MSDKTKRKYREDPEYRKECIDKAKKWYRENKKYKKIYYETKKEQLSEYQKKYYHTRLKRNKVKIDFEYFIGKNLNDSIYRCSHCNYNYLIQSFIYCPICGSTLIWNIENERKD